MVAEENTRFYIQGFGTLCFHHPVYSASTFNSAGPPLRPAPLSPPPDPIPNLPTSLLPLNQLLWIAQACSPRLRTTVKCTGLTPCLPPHLQCACPTPPPPLPWASVMSQASPVPHTPLCPPPAAPVFSHEPCHGHQDQDSHAEPEEVVGGVVPDSRAWHGSRAAAIACQNTTGCHLFPDQPSRPHSFGVRVIGSPCGSSCLMVPRLGSPEAAGKQDRGEGKVRCHWPPRL